MVDGFGYPDRSTKNLSLLPAIEFHNGSTDGKIEARLGL